MTVKTVTLPYIEPTATIIRERTLSDIVMDVALMKNHLTKLEEELQTYLKKEKH